MDQYEYVSFSSAGTRGIVFAGVLDALETKMLNPTYDVWRSRLKGVSGTSSGAIAALIVALGLSAEERNEMITLLSDIRNVIRCPDVTLLLDRCGFENGESFRELIRTVLETGGMSPSSTLRDLKRLLRLDVCFMCTDLSTSSPMILSAEETPDLRVDDALFASCAVPFLFTPPVVRGVAVADGVLTCNTPQVFPCDRTLFVTLGQGAPSSPAGWATYVQSIIRCNIWLQQKMEETIPRQARICVESPAIDSFPAMDFDLRQEQVRVMRDVGYACAFDHLMGGELSRHASIVFSSVLRITLEAVEQRRTRECEGDCEGGPSS